MHHLIKNTLLIKNLHLFQQCSLNFRKSLYKASNNHLKSISISYTSLTISQTLKTYHLYPSLYTLILYSKISTKVYLPVSQHSIYYQIKKLLLPYNYPDTLYDTSTPLINTLSYKQIPLYLPYFHSSYTSLMSRQPTLNSSNSYKSSQTNY